MKSGNRSARSSRIPGPNLITILEVNKTDLKSSLIATWPKLIRKSLLILIVTP